MKFLNENYEIKDIPKSFTIFNVLKIVFFSKKSIFF